MKKQLCLSLLLVLFLFMSSCSVRIPGPGNYYNTQTTYINSLKLNPNGSFILSLENFERKTGYLGRWKYLSKDTILLMYDVKDFPRIVKSEHEFKKEQKVVFINSNALKYGPFVLSKVKLGESVATITK